MELTSEKEQQLTLVYEAYWAQYLKGNVQAMEVLLDESYTQVGSAESEVFTTKKQAVQFLKDTIDEVAGKLEMRNRITQREQQDTIVIVHERCDLYVLDGQQWVFYSKFRATTLLTERKDGWKIIHQHSSFPDSKTEDGQNLAIDKIAEENRELREAVKRRTVELEQKNKELAIEASLERVRARAMAMQNSDELSELVDTVFKELTKLDLALSWCMINIIDEPTMSNTVWGANPEIGKAPESYHMLFEDYRFHHEMFRAWKEKKDKWVFVLKGAEKEIYDAYLFNETEFRRVPEAVQKEMRATKQYVASFTFSNFGGLQTVGEEPLSDENLDILARFGKVFDLTYTRFNDLQKSEAQAREAQIEAALERVRSKTMAMHNSEDVGGTVVTLFDEVMKLGIDQSIRCGIGILEGTERMETWSANYSPSGKVDLKTGMLNMTIHPMLVELKKAWKSKKKAYSYDFIGKDVIKYYTALNKEPQYPYNADLKTLPEKVYHNSFFYSSGILFAFTENPISKEGAKVLNRFAKVFGQTYRRYLDLQKAEEQAREATIESALERVRASSMAMHKSEQLPETAQVLFEQFALLGDIPDRISICILKEEENVVELWATDQIGRLLDHRYWGSLEEPTTMSKMHKAWKEGKDSLIIDLSQQRLKDWLCYIEEEVKLPIDISNIKGRRVQQAAFFSDGFLLLTTNEPVADSNLQLLIRFARVFDQTYTRFLDLQKAEAQAQEARIEAALERVRAASMAMHKTDELAQVVMVLFQQFSELEMDFYQVWINIFFMEEGYSNCWFSPVEGIIEEAYTARIPLEPFKDSSIKSWRAGEEFSYLSWRGLKEVDEISKSLSEMTGHESFIRIQEKKRMDRMEVVDSNHKYGVLAMAKNNDITDNDRIILKRFSKVFEQTYTRFLDLQKAEAQAREAKIEAALERVRAASMAMHHTDELTDVLGVLFEQFDFLGINPVLTHLTLFDEANETFTLRVATGGKKRVVAEQLIDVNAVESWKTSFANWKNSELHAVDCIDYPPEVLPAVWELLDEVMSALPEGQKLFPEDFPDGLYTTQGHCKYGFIGFNHSRRATEEEKDIVIRFAKEFGRLYQRFLDLQLAEKRAKDALKQASLDRVRGQIASMRTAADLERITPLVWNELKVLGVPFIRCGVFIIDETTKMVEVYLSAPDGHSLGVLHLQFNANTLTANMVVHWREGNIFKEHWNREEFLSWTRSLIEEGQISDKNTYQGAANPPESLNLHFIPFTQGMLYVGSEDPLNKEQIELVQSLAEAFAIAYARYEDFTKLEKAKQSVETTLTELKTTQTQLVQSEKMASLGELTAGIAHEIQNPLNFVNNFSEVSVELIEEMHEELQKGDLKEALAIAEDVKQNLDKITHHGKRADGIVKGMLQHSRSSSGQKELTDINVLADEYLRLAYHGLRAKDKTFNATMKSDFDDSIGKINIVPQDIGRVILNLITNAFYAVNERNKLNHKGYEPTVSLSTKKKGDQIYISVKDNGNGIPDSAMKKIFQPFFTTKPTGQGTGLGLSLSYDIVSAHGGELKVQTKEGQGTIFKIELPVT